LVLIVTAAVMQIVGAGVLDVVIAAIPIYGEMQVTIIGLAALFGVIYLIAVVAKWTLRRA
jgi:prepilin signal peptidase PulO-like enzyme (type II secretory pathway)